MSQEDKILNYFSFLKRQGRLSSSYLFVGHTGLPFIFNIAKLINCSSENFPCGRCDDCVKTKKMLHPDILLIDPPKGAIKIDAVRQAQKFLSLKSFQAEHKILIVNRVYQLSLPAANAFLKILEEPSANSVIFLISPRTDLILPTVLSRCRKIYLPFCQVENNIPADDAADFISGKSIYIKDRQYLSSFMLKLIYIMRDYLVFNIFGDTKKLINKDNYEIIVRLHYSLPQAQNKLDSILKIYGRSEERRVGKECRSRWSPYH